MERHANYLLVGVLTTVLVIGGLIFALWLGSFGITSRTDHYRIVFTGPVSGMGEGAEVQFNGIKVGEVEHIDLLPQNASLIDVEIKVRHDTPVRDDSVASPASQGISGANIVQITAGSAGRPLLRDVDRGKRPLIRSKPGGMASLLAGGTKVIESANEALARVNRLLSDRNIEALSGSMQDLRTTSGELARNKQMFADAASAINKFDAAATDFQGAAASARGLIDGDGRRTVADLRATIGDARRMIGKLDGQTGQIGATTLPAVNAAMLSLQQTSNSLNGLIRQIRQDPRAVIGKSRAKELELPK